MAKGIRASTLHYTTSRAAILIDVVHIDTARPFQESLGGSQHVMFVDSASRLQRPYGTRDKSASAILGVVKRFVADMGVPRAFRTDNGAKYTNSTFVDYRNGLGIRRELTAPNTPQHNGPLESGLSRAIKAGHAARLEVNALPGHTPRETQGSARSGWLMLMDGVCFVDIQGVQPLRDDGEQRNAFPAPSILRGPPADAGFAVMQVGVQSCQVGVQSCSTAEKNGPSGAPVFFLNF